VPAAAGGATATTFDLTAWSDLVIAEVPLSAWLLVAVGRRVGRDRLVFFERFEGLAGRADFFPSTSAETSNVQRTRRPCFSGGILMARFDTMVCPRSERGNWYAGEFPH
jgi:hypothetical protein